MPAAPTAPENANVMNRIRIIVVDDELSVRRGLRMRLTIEPDIDVVAEAADGSTAVTAATDAQPDVVVMDVQMPGMDGLTATRLIRETVPACAVVMLSMHDGLADRVRAEEAGASAFVAKHDADGDLVEAIRRAANASRRNDANG
jgi:DNA-binding NarL/FixJ family response regulator